MPNPSVSGSLTISQQHGLAALKETDLSVYCPGATVIGPDILAMADQNPRRTIIASFADKLKALESGENITSPGLSSRIIVKIEELAPPLAYPEKNFDFVYARLSLGHLTCQQLDSVLNEFNRVLRLKAKIFIVAYSVDDPDTKIPGAVFDSSTSLTAYPFLNQNGQIEKDRLIKRYFQSQKSLSNHLFHAGFKVSYLDQYSELNSPGSYGSLPTDPAHNLVEVVAVKQ
ncbi:MAG: class I SAM-dependent methyltransferase [Candidatus Shapirobacteria bacterium]|jgi:hypothetical protein